jgi:hypothetical protein
MSYKEHYLARNESESTLLLSMNRTYRFRRRSIERSTCKDSKFNEKIVTKNITYIVYEKTPGIHIDVLLMIIFKLAFKGGWLKASSATVS